MQNDKPHQTKQEDKMKGFKNKINKITNIIGIILLSIAANLTPNIANASDWGCQVLLCTANPGGWTQFGECIPPVKKAIRAVLKGHPWPKCNFSTGGTTSGKQTGPNRADDYTLAYVCPEYRDTQTGEIIPAGPSNTPYPPNYPEDYDYQGQYGSSIYQCPANPTPYYVDVYVDDVIQYKFSYGLRDDPGPDYEATEADYN